jgi:hypothetical protein
MTNKLLSAMIHDVYRWFIHIMYKFSAYLSSLLYETTWYSSRHDFYWKDANPSFFFFFLGVQIGGLILMWLASAFLI